MVIIRWKRLEASLKNLKSLKLETTLDTLNQF